MGCVLRTFDLPLDAGAVLSPVQRPGSAEAAHTPRESGPGGTPQEKDRRTGDIPISVSQASGREKPFGIGVLQDVGIGGQEGLIKIREGGPWDCGRLEECLPLVVRSS